jgi:hypothetical protein
MQRLILSLSNFLALLTLIAAHASAQSALQPRSDVDLIVADSAVILLV